MVNSTFAAFAIARRWRTAFVEPPIAMTTAMAFSNAFRVRIDRGMICFFTALASTSAERFVLSFFSSSSAAMVEEKGRLSPMASIADDIVLAVYIPPQEPAPGQE